LLAKHTTYLLNENLSVCALKSNMDEKTQQSYLNQCLTVFNFSVVLGGKKNHDENMFLIRIISMWYVLQD